MWRWMLAALAVLSASSWPSAVGEEAAVREAKMSHISLLMPFDSRQRVNATPGCFHWESSNEDCVRVEPVPSAACELWEGASSEADLITPTSNPNPKSTAAISCKVRATPVYLSEAGSDSDCGDLVTDVYVAPLARLEILTTARKIGVNEAERISVQAFDAQGNVFSTLYNVRFAWTVSPPSRNGPLRLEPHPAASPDSSKLPSTAPSKPPDDSSLHDSSEIDVVGQRSGYAELSVRVVGSGRKQKKGADEDGLSTTLTSSAVISVVETLRLCPTPVLVQVGTSISFSSYIDRSAASARGRDCDDDYRIQENHRQRVLQGIYVWKEDSQGATALVTQAGTFTAEKKGRVRLTLEEKDFPPNHVTIGLRIVQAEGLLLLMSGSLPAASNELCATGVLGPWLRAQAKERSGAVMQSREWLMVVNRAYYIVSVPLAEKKKVSGLFELSRMAVFVAEPMRFSLAEAAGAALLDFDKIEEMANVVKITPRRVGETKLQAAMAMEATLAETSQAVRIVPLVTVEEAVLRLPLRHEFVIQMQGGTGEYRFSRHSCPEDLVKIDSSGKLWSLDVEGRCTFLGCDRHDPSNCAEIAVIVSQPSRLFVHEERTPYHLPLGAQESVHLEARDVEGEPYTVCGRLKLLHQPMDQIGLRLDPPKGRGFCASITITARAPGLSSPRVWVEQGGASHELSVLVHQPLAIISPPVKAPHNVPTAVVLLGGSDVLEVEGGREDDTRLSMRRESEAESTSLDLDSDLVKSEPGISRSFRVKCASPGRFVVRVQSGREAKEMLLICAEVSFAKIEVITVHGPASIIDQADTSLTVTVPGQVDFLVRYFDRSGMEFTSITGSETAWTSDRDELSTDETAKHLYITPDLLHCSVSFDEKVSEELELFAKGYGVDASFRLVFFTDPVIQPAVHPPILNLPEAVARFRIFGGSGLFSLRCDYGATEVSGRDVTLHGASREAIAHILAEDAKSSAMQPASAQVRIAALHQLRLRTSAKRVQVGSTVQIYVELMDSHGALFARQSASLTTISIQRSTDAILVGLVERSIGWLECSGGASMCAGLWRTNATATAPGRVDLTANAAIGPETLATSAVPLTLHVFEPLRVIPAQVTLLPGSELHLRRMGGPREMGERCSFMTNNAEMVAIVDAEKGGISAVAAGETKVECICVDAESGEEIARASATISVRVIDAVQIVGDGRLVAGGRTRLQVRGGNGESPLALHTAEKHFIWSVDDTNVASIHGDGHSIWLKSSDHQSFSRTVVRLMARFRKQDSYLSASLAVRVVPRLKLISATHLLVPVNASVQIRTNLDGEVRLRYSVVSALSESGKPCKEVEGVSVSATSGVVKVDGFEQDFVVVITMEDEDEDDAGLEAKQSVYVFVQVRHVVALALEMERTTLALNEAVEGKVRMVDNRGFQFSELHTYPELVFFDAIQGILHVAHRRHGNSVTVRGLREGKTILRVDIPAYRALSEYQVATHGYTGPTDYIDLVVVDSARTLEYPSRLTTLHDQATASWAAMDPKDAALLVVSAVSVFIILWLLCIPRLSGNTSKADEYAYNLMHPNARIPGRR